MLISNEKGGPKKVNKNWQRLFWAPNIKSLMLMKKLNYLHLCSGFFFSMIKSASSCIER